MNFKKRVNGSWVDIPSYIHDTSTDTITTLPAVIYTDGTNATIGLKGNTVQSGTPTPDNPVMPQGTGERTGNLFDVNGETDTTNPYITIINNEIKFENVPSGNYVRIIYSAEYAAGTYYISCVASGSNYDAVRLFSNSSFTGATYNSYYGGYYRDFAISGFSTSLTFNNDFKIGFIAKANGGATFTISDIMLSTTEADYEPYGYKIPISSANITTPVYLGEVQTTRRIKKLVLTGDNSETYIYQSQYSRFIMVVSDAYSVGTRKTQCYCSHYNCVYHEEDIDDVPDNSIYINYQQAGTQFCIKTTSYATIEDFKSYLQQQYTNGTPVTLWYVLAEPETGIVNEPLMKIGKYVDELANVSIPTTVGVNTLSVDTTVQPSEFTVTWTGWRDTEVKKYNSDTTIADWETVSISQMENYTIQELREVNWI